MKKSDKINLKDKSVSELSQQLTDFRRQLTESRMKLATGQLTDTSVFKKLKYQIALTLTLITQKSH